MQAKRRLFLSIVVVIIAIVSSVGVFAGIQWSQDESNRLIKLAQTNVWDNIVKDGTDLRNVYNDTTQSQLKAWLPEGAMNFTDGLVWESQVMNWSFDRPEYRDVIQVLNNGIGACGEHVWVYAAFCVAKDIPFRVIQVGYYELGVIDHAWIQVNPSHDNKTWIAVEVAGTCNELDNGKTISNLWNDTVNNNSRFAGYKMVLAYQLNDNDEVTITDVTKTFS